MNLSIANNMMIMTIIDIQLLVIIIIVDNTQDWP